MDLKAASTIQLCRTDEVIYNVMDEEITTRLWSRLETYMTKSLSNKLYLKKQLYELLFGHIYCIIIATFLHLFCNKSYKLSCLNVQIHAGYDREKISTNPIQFNPKV